MHSKFKINGVIYCINRIKNKINSIILMNVGKAFAKFKT